jgi:alkylation response protein AidB-like acyl-CoA dehydrogenase
MHSSVSTFSLKHIGEVSNKLAEHAVNVEADGRWPKASLEICRDEGVFRWFLPNEFEGWAWTEEQIFRGYLGISQSCLTTAFIITQWQAAVRRILATSNKSLRSRIGRGLSDGSCFVTVGISQLTTSRQHTKPPLMATRVEGGYLLTGYAPWVTGASYADLLVLGAVTDIGEQILLAVETRDKGIRCRPGMSLVAPNRELHRSSRFGRGIRARCSNPQWS